MENIKTKKESLEWVAFKVFLIVTLAYGAMLYIVLMTT